ncbi:DUF308 domain-containing protein [Streptomyces spiramenti]|uniref:HdeD family acid-resistance protein n=1 Tax=Streptomyces spiramenti TaxID=2720606 RepID=A0ABX1AF06_9ACTN|nr:DUF308 domain-containing protein [Streptomyces spiramenti]NJP65784.1 HdeD family acid-resistance protein [Streptomyces spiramenti]
MRHKESHTPQDPGRELHRSLGRFAALGAVLVAAGLVGLVYTGVATLGSMVLFGWLLLIGGVVGLLHAVLSRGSNFVWVGLIAAALNLAAGVILIRHPEVDAGGLSLFVALLLLTGGVFRFVGGLVVRGPQMMWTVVQGAFGLVLGLMVLLEWPTATWYVLGTFLSLALLFDGLGLLATGMAGRRILAIAGEPGRAAGGAGEARDGRSPAHGDRRGAGGAEPPFPDGPRQ